MRRAYSLAAVDFVRVIVNLLVNCKVLEGLRDSARAPRLAARVESHNLSKRYLGHKLHSWAPQNEGAVKLKPIPPSQSIISAKSTGGCDVFTAGGNFKGKTDEYIIEEPRQLRNGSSGSIGKVNKKTRG